MRKSLIINAVVLLLMLSSSCKKDNPVSPPAGGGTPVSDAVRQASIGAVEQRFAALTWENYDADKAALVQFLQARPEFEAAGPGTGASVWARFTDGRLLIIANNRPADDTLDQALPLIGAPALLPGSELPISGNARVMNAMGTFYTNTLPVLSPMLQARGYTVNPVTDASVGNLKSVRGDGVFYIRAHGGSGKIRGGTEAYALWTSTKFNPAMDNSLKPDWDAGRLAYFTGYQDRIPNHPDSATVETHFGITKKFVGDYMGFGSNALIYIDACGAFEGDKFREQCATSSDGGTGIVAGWSFVVGDSKATGAAYFVVDRLLGTNRDPRTPENPPQRPFTFQLVYQNLVDRRMDTYTDPKDGSVAFFVFTPTAPEFGLLAPSIKFLWVDEINRRLHIEGFFGTDPRPDGIVTVNGHPLTIQNWIEGEIICSIPPSGTSAAGNVIVTVRGHRSNVVQLTEWIGEVRMVLTSGWVGLNITVTYNLHLRADVHSFRERPNGTPQAAPRILTRGAPDAHGDWSLGGQTVARFRLEPCDVVTTETWSSASGTLPISSFVGNEDGVLMDFDIRPRTRTMKLTFGARASNSVIWNGLDSITCGGNTVVFPSSGIAGFATGGDTLELSFAPNFDIMSITPVHHPNFLNPQHYPVPPPIPTGLTTIECAGIQARFPPADTSAQRPLVSARGIK